MRLQGSTGREAGVCLLVSHVTEGKSDIQRGAVTGPRSHSRSKPGPESKAGARSIAWSHCEYPGKKEQLRDFPGGSDGKESACRCRRCGFEPWVGKIPWRRK